jgi:tRNA-dihydrouridine synthase B
LPQIGRYRLAGRVLAAPMAGVTDLPFRRLCRRFGAALAAGEMMSSDPRLWDSRKSRLRRVHDDEPEPRTVQIAGSEPQQMAEAALRNVAAGAQIIDLNMGCPAKKVCNRAAGSALLRDEPLVEAILRAVVDALPDEVPVTLKMRTGWSPAHRNGVAIARIAEDAGIAALAVHGRTRECRFAGVVEYDTIAAIKAAVRIPVFANGDIDGPASARHVLEHTGADGVMIGRAALGRPWIFRVIDAALRDGAQIREPSPSRAAMALSDDELRDTMLAHLRELYAFYGDEAGVRIARKHVDWYCRERAGSAAFRQAVMATDSAERQFALVEEHLYQAHTPGAFVAAA